MKWLVMVYVYILRSVAVPNKTYVGLTNNLRRRFKDHNSGQSDYTKQFVPWKLEAYIAFNHLEKAKAFERYLKKAGGWRFAKRRLI